MSSLTRKLAHVCIVVRDLDAALHFYRDVLGFESVLETDNGSADGALLGFDRDAVSIRAHHVLTIGADRRHATEINIVEFVDPRTSSHQTARRAMNDAGLTRLALLVDDLDEAFERIACFDGVEVVCEPREIVVQEAAAAHSSRWFSFRDPFGVFITVTEPEQESRPGEKHHG